MKTNLKSQIIQAIKALDIEQLDVLLDDDRTYMEVSKTQFLDKLKEKFKIMKEVGHHSFDDVFFGVCQGCQKGCEGMTFLSDAGFYLDILIKEEEGAVVDVRICNELVNFIPLEKTNNFWIRFTKDERVGFLPHEHYRTIEYKYESILEEVSLFPSPIKLDDFITWYEDHRWFNVLMTDLNLTDFYNFRLYVNAYEAMLEIENVLAYKAEEYAVIDILIDLHQVKTERDQLIWLFENFDNHLRLDTIVVPQDFESHSCIQAQIRDQTIRVDISGYEHVLEYFQKMDSIHNYFLDKYQPLPEHLKQNPKLRLKDLIAYLRLHNAHMDIVERYCEE